MSGKNLSPARGNDRFVARRRNRRRRVVIASGILLLLLLAAAVYALNQEFARITTVQAFGPDSLSTERQEALIDIATQAMQGSYLGIVPHNSILFFPASRIRYEIHARYLDIAAVSLFRTGLNTLTLRVDTRVPIAQWCGDILPDASSAIGTSTPRADTACFYFDANGMLYATTTEEQPVNTFRFYERYNPPPEMTALGFALPNAQAIPAAFDFARQLTTFGSSVTAVVFRDREVDDYLASGTRITYMRGKEQQAFTALSSARDSFDLTDGSLEYVDLRFDGKVYVKRKR